MKNLPNILPTFPSSNFTIFPNSKFILALRNTFDSVMSCFMQPFTPNDAMANFYNLSDATKLYDEVFKLWMQYEKKLKIKFHKIKYEEIVEDFDSSISSLLKFFREKKLILSSIILI